MYFNSTSQKYAATLCYELSDGSFSDWYLPSVWELQTLSNNLSQMPFSFYFQGFTPGATYWTSNEADTNMAWLVVMSTGATSYAGKDLSGTDGRVRAIRRF